jgi:shikimate kinase
MGGGTLIHPASLKIVKESQQRVIVMMMRDEQSLLQRIKEDTKNIRPLLRGENPQKQLKDLMDKRRDHYLGI